MPYDDPKMRVTLSGKPPEPGFEDGSQGAPAPIDERTGMHKDYWVLPEEERRKGFIRPFRDTYTHAGTRPKYPTRELDEEQRERHAGQGYVRYEPYPAGSTILGRYWTLAQLSSGCGTNTTMSRPLAETYARDPSYYGSTFCCHCGTHFPVREFVWTGTNDLVGS